jgi:transketolase
VASIRLIPQSEFIRVRAAKLDADDRLRLLAEMCRFNTLSAVKRAGSGHLGSSFSAMDFVVWLYFKEMNTLSVGVESPDRDVYFSSKGHDVPGLYSVLFAAEVLTQEKFLMLRRLGGLDGHPDVGVAGIEANSGSLGMGISKGKGLAWARRLSKRGGRIFVCIGDGELQEGQNYEALMTSAVQGIASLTVIVDHNKVQTDLLVSQITDLRDLEAKFRDFGWAVARCDGHSFADIERAIGQLNATRGQPRILIADTIKGRGVSFMEHPQSLRDGGGVYRWHAGAPDDESFHRGSDELYARVEALWRAAGLGRLATIDVGEKATAPAGPPQKKEYVADAFGEALLEAGARRKDLVVLDGDLATDCRVRTFQERFPDRFIENGIAEQDMVSTAAGLARSGFLPVVNSFASFLASRANEQIYNAATERSKVIYACHFGGLIPAGPGKSHQSLRDISLFGALPECTIIQPANPKETKLALDYLIDEAKGVGVLRLAIGPSPRSIALPAGYRFSVGRGARLTEGLDALLFAYGPVMLHEALSASELLAARRFGLSVVNHPWLNRFDVDWLRDLIEPYQVVCVLDDHAPVGGLADRLLDTLVTADALGNRKFVRFAVDGFPACGAPGEVLRYHRLDGASLAEAILGERPTADTAVDERSYTLEAPQ